MARIAMTVDQKAELGRQYALMWQELSSTVQKEHEAVERAFLTLLPSAVRAGMALAKAKGKLDDCRWRNWLKAHGVPVRKAELYIALAAEYPSFAQGALRLRESDVRSALRMLASGAAEGQEFCKE